MSKAIFDTSAILTIYHKEPGRKKVLQLIERHEPLISSVNLAELYSKLFEDGLNESEVTGTFEGLDIVVIDFSPEHAVITGSLRGRTKQLGLSLGDRACLSVGIKEKAVVITADRSWGDLADLCTVEVIR